MTVKSPELIIFNAERMVWGLVFHIVDGGYAPCVDIDSVAEALVDLRETTAVISRSEWRHMTNEQRLDYLMDTTGIGFIVIGDTAELIDRNPYG